MPHKNIVYVQHAYLLASDRHIKIGYAIWASERMRAFKSFDSNLKIVGYRKGGMAAEKEMLALARTVAKPIDRKKEWFPFSDTLLALLAPHFPIAEPKLDFSPGFIQYMAKSRKEREARNAA